MNHMLRVVAISSVFIEKNIAVGMNFITVMQVTSILEATKHFLGSILRLAASAYWILAKVSPTSSL